MKWPSWLTLNVAKRNQASWNGIRSSFLAPLFDEGDTRGFWDWFLANEALLSSGFKLYLAGDKRNNAHGNALGAALNRFHPGLVFEIGKQKNGKLDFVISADGIFESFPAVLSLVNSAPDSALFQFTAFRQRTTHVSLEMFGEKFNAKTARFAIQPSNYYLGKFDLALYLGEYPLDEKQLWHAAYILLDSTIGEYDMETLIGGFDVLARPPENESATRPLSELPVLLDQYLSSRKAN